MSVEADLARILAHLESADRTLVEALDRRARAIRDLLALQEAHPDEFFRIPRDEDVVRQALSWAESFPKERVEPVLHEVLSACASLIAPRTVALQGGEGGFTHEAARRRFGAASVYQPFGTVHDVLEEVVRGRAAYGVLPLETSTDGAITATLHGLAGSDVKICGELTLASHYHLMSATGNPSDIEKVYGSPTALAACARFLRNRFPKAAVLDVHSGEAAAHFASADHGAAVVGSSILAELHELRVVQERVEDAASAETRYAIVSTELPSRTGADRTVLAMAVHDDPGALYAALAPFANRHINLTRLESRPARGEPWRYLFFVELDGHITDRSVVTAMDELRSISRHVKVLGSYPKPAAHT